MAVPFLCTGTTVETKEVIEVQFLFCWQFYSFLFVFLFWNKKPLALLHSFIAQTLMLVLRPHEHVSIFRQGDGYPGGKLAKKPGNWSSLTGGKQSNWSTLKTMKSTGGQAAHSRTMVPADMQGGGGKPLSLPVFHKNCRGTSLYPRKTSFLWKQNPLMVDCFGDYSTRYFDNHEKLSVKKQHH